MLCLISLHVGRKCSGIIFHTRERCACVWPVSVNRLKDSKRQTAQTAGLRCPHQFLTTDRLRSPFCRVETLLLWKLGAVLDSGNNLAWPRLFLFFPSHSVTLWPLSKPVTLLLLLLLVAHQLCRDEAKQDVISLNVIPMYQQTLASSVCNLHNHSALLQQTPGPLFFFSPYFLEHVVIKWECVGVVFARIHGEKNQTAMIKKATRPGWGGTEPAAD